MYFNLLFVFLFGLLWLVVATFLRIKKKKSFTYLLLFALFSIYLFKVLDYTLFQFQSLLLLKYFMPNLILRGQATGQDLNLIPLFALTQDDIKTSFLNILLFVPFGLGLPFITRLWMEEIVVVGFLFSVIIELLQLLTGYLAKITFRIADINDVIFNTLGVVIGYILFVVVVRTCRSLSHNQRNSMLRYLSDRPQIEN